MLKKTLLGVLLGGVVLLYAEQARCQPLKEVPKDALKAGDPAPRLVFQSVLQGPQPAEVNWQRLAGKVVILDFWGTWCAPCVAGIPHLNALIAKYGDQPVQFVAVGHENAKKVAWFLEKHPINAWIALDLDLSVYRSYFAFGIPHAVIVDGKGIVAAVLNPSDLTEAVLDDVLAGHRPTYPPLPPEAYWNPDNAMKWFREVGAKDPPPSE
jgi:thiol-disulfide isomerase/thioredoxin